MTLIDIHQFSCALTEFQPAQNILLSHRLTLTRSRLARGDDNHSPMRAEENSHESQLSVTLILARVQALHLNHSLRV